MTSHAFSTRKSKSRQNCAESKPDPVIYLVDDDKTHLDYSLLILEMVGVPVKPFSSASQFLQHCPPDPIGVLVTDVLMPGTSGVKLHEILIRESIELPVIFLTGFANVSLTREVLKAGAFDFIEKPLNPEDVIASASRAIQSSVQAWKERQLEKTFQEKLARLTPRERQILRLMLDYEQTCDIVRKLNISARTIESHKSGIFKKMEVDGFVELACEIIRMAGIEV